MATPYHKMTDDAVKETARRIIKDSITHEEAERRMGEEMPGYPGGMAMTFIMPSWAKKGVDKIGAGMFMAMIHGPFPRGNTIHL